MKRLCRKPFALAALLLPGTAAILLPRPAPAQVLPAPALMNFQGRLARPDGTPVADGTYSIRFSLWDAASGGVEKWNQTIASAAVTNGVFDVLLDVGAAGLFNGNLWLEIKIGTDAPLAPRQRLVSSAYALKANTVPDGSIGLSQLAGGVLNFGNLGGSLVGSQITNGTITADKLAFSVGGSGWNLIGNAGTDPATHFLGTTDNQPLLFKANNRQAMRYSYAEGQFGFSINVLGGVEINSVGASVVGATIAGGGYKTGGAGYPNRVNADFGTVGGGDGNTASGPASTVAGGELNVAGGLYAFSVGGGNSANGGGAAISGGVNNTASADLATVAGGSENIASGENSFVAGGRGNTASGLNSFAAGFQASANHNGAFVWGDSQNSFFASTGINQFLIRAAGGVGINTNAPGSFALNVNGSAQFTGFSLPTGAASNKVLTSDASGLGTWQFVNFANLLGSLGLSQIPDGLITGAKLAPGLSLPPSGTAGGDLSGAYPNPTIASSAVTSVKIADSAVTSVKIADSAVSNAKIANNAVTTLKIADGSVTAAKLAPGLSLPPSGTAGGDLSGTYPNPAIASNPALLNRVSGGVLTSNAGYIGINTATPAGLLDVINFVPTTAQVPDTQQTALSSSAGNLDQWQSFTPATTGYLTRLDLNIGSPLGPIPAYGTLSIYAGEGTAGTLLTSLSVVYQPGFNTYQTYNLTNPPLMTAGQQYTYRLTTPTLTHGWIPHWDGTYAGGRSSAGPTRNLLFKTYITPSGASASVLKVSGGSVGVRNASPNAAYALDVAGIGSFTGGIRFGDGTTQTTAALSLNSAAGGDLSGTYPNPTIASSAVTTAKIADASVTAAKLAAGVIPTSLPPSGTAGGDLSGAYPNPTIASSAVTSVKIADNAVTTAKLADSAISTVKIADSAVTSIKIADSAVSTTKIADSAVSTTKIVDSAVSSAKLASDGASLSKVSGGAMTNSGGNIGIGVASPSSKVDVSGSVTAGGFIASLLRGGTGRFDADNGLVIDRISGNNGTLSDSALHFGFNSQGGYSGQGIASKRSAGGNQNGIDIYTASAARISITNGGYVGIGTTAPAFRLELPNVNSNDGKGRANAWVTYSSGRWKHNVTAIENPLEKLLQLRGVMFDWNQENGGGHDIGFVAEEVGAVIPELVTWEKDGKFAQGLKYDRVSALLVEAVKTLKKDNDAVKAENAAKDARIQSLEARLAAIEKLLRERK